MQSTSTRESSRPSSIFAGMLSPGRISHSSNHTRSPSFLSRSATSRTTGLSLALWLRNASYWKVSLMSRDLLGAVSARRSVEASHYSATGHSFKHSGSWSACPSPSAPVRRERIPRSRISCREPRNRLPQVGRVCPQRAGGASARFTARWGQTRPTDKEHGRFSPSMTAAQMGHAPRSRRREEADGRRDVAPSASSRRRLRRGFLPRRGRGSPRVGAARSPPWWIWCESRLGNRLVGSHQSVDKFTKDGGGGRMADGQFAHIHRPHALAVM